LKTLSVGNKKYKFLFMKLATRLLIVLVSLLSITCAEDLDSENFGPGNTSNDGINGSYSQIIVYGDWMYGLQENLLTTLDITDKSNIQIIHQQELAFDIESIFRYDNLLFIGSSSSMYIYEIDSAGIPKRQSVADYFTEDDEGAIICWQDPIVADDQFAYATLSTSRVIERCGRSTLEQVNELRIFNITDISNPLQVAALPMFNPKGLAKSNDFIYVCDDTAGLKVVDVSTPESPELVSEVSGFTAYDAVVYRGLLLVVGGDSFIQFDISNPFQVEELSRINF